VVIVRFAIDVLKKRHPIEALQCMSMKNFCRKQRHFKEQMNFRLRYRKRVVAEHRIAGLVCLGIRQARYFGSKKTLFQLAMAAAVANLTMLPQRKATESIIFCADTGFCDLNRRKSSEDELSTSYFFTQVFEHQQLKTRSKNKGFSTGSLATLIKWRSLTARRMTNGLPSP